MPSLDPKTVVDITKNTAEYLKFNHTLIDIFENNLCGYLDADLKAQLSHQSYTQASFRKSPINVLPKVIDKLTNIYQTAVIREVPEGNETDKELLKFYESYGNINSNLNSSNEMFNLCRASLIYPCVQDGSPVFMVIENDRFIPIALNPLYPTKLTHVILLGGKVGNVDTFWVWSDTEFYIVDSDHNVRTDLMAEFGNLDGINPIGRLPFIYVNESKRKIMPTQDYDMLEIVKLIPVMLTDLNLAAMFQSFSIIFGIDVNDESLVYAPNAFWRLKSDPNSGTDNKPQIGQLKPQVDFQQVLELISTQLSLWLGTKGIRASAVGGLDKDNFASGISKVIDEMDTFEARQKQVTVFQCVERELWDLVLNYMHPYWVDSGQITETTLKWSSPEVEVKTSFQVQLPMQTRGQYVKDVKEEYAAGFTSRKRAIGKLNPELSSDEIEALITEIDEERGGVEIDGEPAENNPRDPEGSGPQTESGVSGSGD